MAVPAPEPDGVLGRYPVKHLADGETVHAPALLVPAAAPQPGAPGEARYELRDAAEALFRAGRVRKVYAYEGVGISHQMNVTVHEARQHEAAPQVVFFHARLPVILLDGPDARDAVPRPGYETPLDCFAAAQVQGGVHDGFLPHVCHHIFLTMSRTAGALSEASVSALSMRFPVASHQC